MFPECLKIFITEKSSLIPVANYAIRITLYAQRKNNYTILLITKDNGEIELSREMAESEIQQSRDHFPMDYSSTLSDCKKVIRIDLLSIDEIDSIINGMRVWADAFSDIPELIEKLRKSDNEKYKSYYVMIDINADIRLEVERAI